MFDFKNIKIKAVLLSILTYFATTFILGIVLSIFTTFPLMKNYDMQDPEQQKLFAEALIQDTTYQVGILVLALLGSFLGGIVAAKVAKVAELTNALVTGAILFIIGLIYMALSSQQLPIMITLISWVLMFAGLFGGAYLVTPEEKETTA